jgi:signal transduction histidine kinase
MSYRHGLRYRITVAFFLFGTLLTGLLALAVYLVVENIEEGITEQALRAQLEYFLAEYRSMPEARLPHSATFRSYVARDGDTAALPGLVRDLAPGIHEVSSEGRTYRIIVGDAEGDRVYLLQDATLYEQRERAVFTALVLLVVVAGGLALWIGYALSRRVIAPVSNLAARVAALEPEAPATPLAASFANDEIGGLAQAFDLYTERLRRFVEREREFTADASHELRTPLTVIQGALELLDQASGLAERDRRVLDRIERAVREMAQVLEGLLLLARERSGGTPSDAGDIDVGQVVAAVVAESRCLVAEKPVRLHILAQASPRVAAPEVALAVVLRNLVRNAIAYTPSGTVRVRVDDGGVEVEDTGLGIPADRLPRVFDPLYRAHDGHAPGAGLGLSIVKRVCERYGWTVSAQSDEGAGTRIRISFPARRPGR